MNSESIANRSLTFDDLYYCQNLLEEGYQRNQAFENANQKYLSPLSEEQPKDLLTKKGQNELPPIIMGLLVGVVTLILCLVLLPRITEPFRSHGTGSRAYLMALSILLEEHTIYIQHDPELGVAFVLGRFGTGSLNPSMMTVFHHLDTAESIFGTPIDELPQNEAEMTEWLAPIRQSIIFVILSILILPIVSLITTVIIISKRRKKW